LRKKLIGQVVNYTVEYKSNTNKEYGFIHLPSGENVVQSIVAEGWARVLPPPQGRTPKPYVHLSFF
jgi:hypothetical protein